MVIIKTKMKEIPETCRECELHIFMYGNLVCPVLRDWIEPSEYREGKNKLKNCPLEEGKNETN